MKSKGGRSQQLALIWVLLLILSLKSNDIKMVLTKVFSRFQSSHLIVGPCMHAKNRQGEPSRHINRRGA